LNKARIVDAALTDVGRKRELNEDSYIVSRQDGLYVVADGMGGHSAGEIASQMAVKTIAAFIKKTSQDREITWPFQREKNHPDEANRLIVATKLANAHVYNSARANAKYHGMGTTVVAAFVSGDMVYTGHVGDSRIYRIRDGKIEQITEDHSLLTDHLKSHKLTPEEAANFPFKNVITRALGVDEDVEVDIRYQKVRNNDIFLLCSDGLSGLVSDAVMQNIVLKYQDDLETASKELIATANRNGGNDNITVILFRTFTDGADSDLEDEDDIPKPPKREDTRPLPEDDEDALQSKDHERSEELEAVTVTSPKKREVAATDALDWDEDALEEDDLSPEELEQINFHQDHAQTALEQRDFDSAEYHIHEIMAIHADNPESKKLIQKLRHYKQQEDFKKKVELTKIERIIEDGIEIYEDGDYPLAKKYFQKVLALDSANEEANEYMMKIQAKIIEEDEQQQRERARARKEQDIITQEMTGAYAEIEAEAAGAAHAEVTPLPAEEDFLVLEAEHEPDDIINEIIESEDREQDFGGPVEVTEEHLVETLDLSPDSEEDAGEAESAEEQTQVSAPARDPEVYEMTEHAVVDGEPLELLPEEATPEFPNAASAEPEIFSPVTELALDLVDDEDEPKTVQRTASRGEVAPENKPTGKDDDWLEALRQHSADREQEREALEREIEKLDSAANPSAEIPPPSVTAEVMGLAHDDIQVESPTLDATSNQQTVSADFFSKETVEMANPLHTIEPDSAPLLPTITPPLQLLPDSDAKDKDELPLVKNAFALGLTAMENERYYEAILAWRQVRELDPAGKTRYFRNSKVLIKIATMKLLEKLQPLIEQAKLHHQKGNLFKASTIFKQILKEYPEHMEAKTYLEFTGEVPADAESESPSLNE
jgi:protein phosphatase